jgi:RNA polymerase sigma-70 factor, ECF subfamily
MLAEDQQWSRRVPSSAWQQEFLELLELHGATLMGMLRRLCCNHHNAEDVFQDTAVRIWRSFFSRPRLRNPKVWVMTIGYRAFLDTQRRQHKLEVLSDVVDDRSGSPRQVAEHAEECDRLQSAISDLPEPIREVVVLHYVGGLTLSQTAAAMEISRGTVKSRLNAALTKLRSVLQ